MDNINQMIALSVITLSNFQCILKKIKYWCECKFGNYGEIWYLRTVTGNFDKGRLDYFIQCLFTFKTI